MELPKQQEPNHGRGPNHGEEPNGNSRLKSEIEEFFPMVYRLALAQTKNRSYADDIVQEVFIRYIKSSAKLKDSEHKKAWLIRVTINCAKSMFSTAWFQKTVPLEEDVVFDTKEKSDVYYAVLELPQKYRAVIHLYYYEDMSVTEIADTLKISEGTVKTRLFRARKSLKEILKGGYEID